MNEHALVLLEEAINDFLFFAERDGQDAEDARRRGDTFSCGYYRGAHLASLLAAAWLRPIVKLLRDEA